MRRRTILGIMLTLSVFAGSLPAAPVSAKTVIYPTEATGEKVEENEKCVIDYSNCQDGYVVVQFKEQTTKVIKAQVKKGSRTYTYTLRKQSNEVLPLTEGNGWTPVVVTCGGPLSCGFNPHRQTA